MEIEAICHALQLIRLERMKLQFSHSFGDFAVEGATTRRGPASALNELLSRSNETMHTRGQALKEV